MLLVNIARDLVRGCIGDCEGDASILMEVLSAAGCEEGDARVDVGGCEVLGFGPAMGGGVESWEVAL